MTTRVEAKEVVDPEAKGSSTLRANAASFDVSRSPTLDPYSGQHGVATRPGYVPPAQIPPMPTQMPKQSRTRSSQQPQTQQQQQQRQYANGAYDAHSNEADRSARRMGYPPQMAQQQQQQAMQQRHPQHAYPPQMAGHAKGYPPNFQGYPPQPNMARASPQEQHYRQQQQQQAQAQAQAMGGRGYPPQQAQYGQANRGHPTPQQQQQQAQAQAMGHGYAQQSPQQQQQQQQQTKAPSTTSPPMNTAAATAANGSHQKANVEAVGKSPSKAAPNGSRSKQQQPQGGQATSTAPAVKSNAIKFKTFSSQKDAVAVGSTMAYKHPSRSHYGQPDEKLRDPKFTNPAGLLHIQRWELLESAKRWLPGEGTMITWKNHRYLIGPPIHMGMNGHIHYCYKYPLPKHKRTSKTKKAKTAADGTSIDAAEDSEEEEIEEIDINSPCVETLAAKIVPNTPAFAREIVILRALQDCENVTELYDVLESERTLISILELAQADVYNFFVGRGSTRHGWNLDKPAVREHFSKMVISNVVQGLDQMHRAEYLHCDLKSLNILLYIYVTDHSNRRGGVYIKAKLTDFGHSSHGTTRIAEKLFSNGMARVGTAGHVAPELFKEGSKCTDKIDIWSLGIVMFSMLVPGRLLFSEYTNLENLKRGYDRLNKMNPWSRDRPSWWTDFERLSPEARDLILWMTRYEPSARPTCAEILKHPWFLIGKAGHREHYRPKLKYVDMLCSSSIAQE